MSAKRQTEIAEALLRRWGSRCSCGGPQYGTDHSPDCSLELDREAAWDAARDELEAEEGERVLALEEGGAS